MSSSAPRRRPDSASTTARAARGKRVAPKKRRTSFATRVAPVLIGTASLVLAGVGAVAVGEVTPEGASPSFAATSSAALSFDNTTGVDISRSAERDARRTEEQEAQQAEQIALLAQQASDTERQVEERTEEIANQWVLPVTGYRLSARFGQRSGLWSSGTHTGVDFAGASGSTIVSVAAGTVTRTGYEGAYGNLTVITLEDGTEVWYAHQSQVTVTAGQAVGAGEVIGYTGATGNVTGPHLHLEVRPGGGDPVDPVAILAENRVFV